MRDSPLEALLDTALLAAKAAGDVTLTHYQTLALSVETKRDGSPVTIADREAEQTIRRIILDRFPDHSILGEEFATTNDECLAPQDDNTPQWVIDPIDGTASFIRGVPLYGTLIGVTIRGTPVVGVMHFPALGETVSAATGAGAWYRAADAAPVRATVSSTAQLSDAICCTTSDDYFRQTQTRQVWSAVRDACASTRGWSDAYAFMLLASGRIDAVVEPPVLHPWDAAAAIPVIKEAGGAWTDWYGACSPACASVLATNKALHDPLAKLIASAMQTLT